MRRLAMVLLVMLGLAPGTWLWAPRPPPDRRQILSVRALPLPQVALGPLELRGAWVLDSPNDAFGSYSALVALGDGSLLAGSDKGAMARFPAPGGPPGEVRIGYFAHDGSRPKGQLDLESMTRDPASGRLWLGFEGHTRIERFDAGFRAGATVRPAAMRSWPGNQGPEAMARLADGRFIVIAEGARFWAGQALPGLLFGADPVAGAAPVAFRFVPPAGFQPVDMAQLPDGRVLILLRDVLWGLPPGFAGKLMLADPATIRAGRAWPAALLADLAAPLPSDNFEGLAVEPDGAGGAVLWLISDDNESTSQRTLLLKLAWPANAKARGIVRAPR